MAAGSFTLYSKSVLAMTKAQMNLSTDTFIVALLTSSYTPSDTHGLWSDVSAYELAAGNGYTQGGLVLTETDTLTGATTTFSASNPSWASFSAGPFKYAMVSRRAGASLVAGDLLLGYWDLNTAGGSAPTGGGGAYTLQINASGIFTITHTP